MITGAHSIIYSKSPEGDRVFLREVLKLTNVDGWGVLTQVTLPGGGKLGVYEPRHARPKPMSAG